MIDHAAAVARRRAVPGRPEPLSYHRPMAVRPIGMFDSGFGGLTVARAFMDLCPNESLVYFGDTARYPYGPRPLDEVRAFAHEIAERLVRDHDVKFLVVACNTASAAALDELAAELPIPVIGVIAPGARALVSVSERGRVGVIGTVGTIASGAYQAAVRQVDPGIALECGACPGFVEFVERGETTGDQITILAERLLEPLRRADIDALLLGCTHYPFLARTIGTVMGPEVVLVSSADETAFAIRRILEDTGMAAPEGNEARYRFISSGDPAWFEALGRRLLGPELAAADGHTWD